MAQEQRKYEKEYKVQAVKLAGFRGQDEVFDIDAGGPSLALFRRVNPKFCVNSIWGANRAKFIQGGSRGIRLLPC
ncbi:MAG: hypothetical protein HFF67_01660 [Oscillospiraceae bacterium]|nr:hypothetical protein [Oscillospiraceae bacterium]MCI9316724.1 hypothetical protein [Oscillospiraceae bacterium]